MAKGETISNLLLPGLSIGQNAMGLMKANRDVKQANAMSIPSVDWRQKEAYDDLQNKARTLETGTAYAPQQEAILQQGLGSLGAVARTAGGGVGSTISGINMVNRGTGRLLNELYGGMSQEGLQLQNLIQSTANNMANRSLNIAVANKQQALADAMKRKKQYQQNLTTAMTDVFGGGIIDDVPGGKKGGGSGGAGGAINGIKKGATTGAAVGSVIPVLGTAAGGVVGGILGGIGSLFRKETPQVQ